VDSATSSIKPVATASSNGGSWWFMDFSILLSTGDYFVGSYANGNAVQDYQYNASITTFSPLT